MRSDSVSCSRCAGSTHRCLSLPNVSEGDEQCLRYLCSIQVGWCYVDTRHTGEISKFISQHARQLSTFRSWLVPCRVRPFYWRELLFASHTRRTRQDSSQDKEVSSPFSLNQSSPHSANLDIEAMDLTIREYSAERQCNENSWGPPSSLATVLRSIYSLMAWCR